MFKAVAEHAISCPLCHSLLNEVKGALAVVAISPNRNCRHTLEAADPCQHDAECFAALRRIRRLLDRLSRRISSGQVFHRWERHAVFAMTARICRCRSPVACGNRSVQDR
jgi:hypothetical protein